MTDQRLADEGQPMTFEEYAAKVLCGAEDSDVKSMSMLLTCMDYRYPRRIVDAMQRIWSAVPYDQFVLAGAALGACRLSWQDAFVQHVEIALKLGHRIDRIVILDHRDCGAYRNPRDVGVPETILKTGLPKDVLPSVEKACHQDVLTKLVPMLRTRLGSLIDNLKIDAWLLARDEDDSLTV